MSSLKEALHLHIRWMIRLDMDQVMHIENESSMCPWTWNEFLVRLRQKNCIGKVAEHGEKIVGFMVYELHRHHLHVLNFAVHPQWRRSGVGTQMVAKLVSKVSSHRRTRITLEIRETNLAAQLFYRKQSFRAIRVLRKHYDDSGEDGIVMQYRLGGEPDDIGNAVANRVAQFF